MCGKEFKYSILKTVPDDNNDGENHPAEKNERCLYVTRRWFKTSSRAAAVVCLVGLLLFVGLWIQCVYARNLDGAQSRYNNLVEKNKQLTIRLNVSNERDQLQTNYNNLSKERDQLQTNYNTLSKERDQLQTNYNNLSKERDKLQTNYNNLFKERDQLQTELEQEQEEEYYSIEE